MSTLSIIALLTGVAGVILTIKQNIWCWPMALISVVISCFEFYESRLFGDMGLQIFYFISGVYGWFFWSKNKGENFTVTSTPISFLLPLLVFTGLQYILYFYLLNMLRGDKIIFDAILTACSITVTFMMTKKWIENWICWVAIDAAYIVLYISKDLYMYALLYLLFTIMALLGYLNWRKQLSYA